MFFFHLINEIVFFFWFLGVLDIFRLVMGKIKINIELEQISDTKFKYIIETPLTTRETTFELGKEQRDTFIDQRKFTVSFLLLTLLVKA